MKAYIEAGAAGVHFEDQLASEKKCGHLGGKVLVPTSQFVRTLVAARLAADVCGVPTVLVARTDALSATLLTSDIDERDREFTTGERTPEGFFRVTPGIEAPIARSLAYAPYADVLWFETATPDMDEARPSPRRSTSASRASSSRTTARRASTGASTWSDAEIERFQRELGELGYRYQFITLAGFHSLNAAMFELAQATRRGHARLRPRSRSASSSSRRDGYTATRHQREVGAGYFDAVMEAVSGGRARRWRSGLDGGGQFETAAHGVTLRREVVAPADAEILTPDALALRRAAPARAGPRRARAARAPRASGSGSSTPARRPTSCPRRRTSATASGGSRLPRPTCATGASRSPARSTAR